MSAVKSLAHRETFRLFLIKPSHYDDNGYVIQWVRSEIPSNTMAALNALALDCRQRQVLGENVDLEIIAADETNTRIKPKQIIRAIRASGGKGLVVLLGVQSNQFPRALDIARPLREAGIQVAIGGFHVSGCLSMLPETPPELQAARELGICLFAGEAEGRFDEILRDAWRDELKPLYNYLPDLPGLEGVPGPILPRSKVKRNINSLASFDAGRGCPFQCSFCTIINVQGRKSRYRSADDIELIMRANHAQGVTSYFITDDNFARNKNWESIFDRIIALREDEGMEIKLIIQVDTLCHLIPNFLEKSRRAGVNRVFIGLENINPDNLTSAKKKQNRIIEYRAMLQAWKKNKVMTYCGYIIGFPNDTPERILRDIEIIKRELPVDLVEFFCLTPLPGSQDHKDLAAKGVWMDPDLNKYDLEHVCTGHPLMTPAEFQDIYHRAWEAFYSVDHVETIMRRAVANGVKSSKIVKLALWFYGCQAIEKVHPLQGGLFRRKYRRDRRPGLPIEGVLPFYLGYLGEVIAKHARLVVLLRRFLKARARVERDPDKEHYTDLALTPPQANDLEALELFTTTDAAPAKTPARKASLRPRKVAAAE